MVFSSTTGFLNWKTQDVTDLDYTPRPILTRDNTEKDFQFTQEIRFASAETAPVRLADARPVALAGGRVPLHAVLRAGRHQQLLAVRRGAVSGQPAHAAFGARRLRARPVRSGHGHVQRPAGPRCRRAIRLRGQERDARELLRAADRARPPGSTPTRASRTSRRRRRSATGSSPTRRSTRRSAAATRPAASTRRRPRAARRTARSSPGTSKAA